MENIIQPPIPDDKEKAEFLKSAKQSFAGIIIGNQIRTDQKFMGVFDESLKERQEAEKKWRAYWWGLVGYFFIIYI